MEFTKGTKAHIGLVAANIFFAANLSMVKHLHNNGFIKPFAITFLRVALSVILFWFMYSLKPSTWRINKKDIPAFLLCAFTGVAVNQLLFLKGLTLTYSIHAALLSLITPILITFIAAWLLRERLSFFKIAGLALGIGGAYILISGKESTGEGINVLVGDLLVIINAISYTFYMVLVKPLMKKYPPLQVIRWVFTFGFFMVFPFGISDLMEVNWSSWGVQEFLFIGMIAVAGTFLAYLFNVYGIKILGSSIAGAYIYSQPVFATAIAMIFLKESLVINQVIAAALIFAGVYLANKQSSND